ncbi:unnamed protein product [Symbiodinium sp. CCMP2592]|nr:unnamed protein product [Symbiodinium sp. CCMP2592]
MVFRTIRKERDNLPYRRQSVISFFAIVKVAGHAVAGEITSEKRDDNDKKIAYTVRLYGMEDQHLVRKEVTIAVADVKHSCGTGFEKAVEELRDRAEKLELSWSRIGRWSNMSGPMANAVTLANSSGQCGARGAPC